MADAESTEVLNAILAPSTPAKASEAGGEAAPRPADAPSRAADGRFASNEPAEADAGDDDVTDAILEGEEPADDQPADDQAVAELKREIADEMADCIGPAERIGALKAERFALERLRGRLEAYLNDLMVVERKTEQKTHG